MGIGMVAKIRNYELRITNYELEYLKPVNSISGCTLPDFPLESILEESTGKHLFTKELHLLIL
jgi:hypothetical protein